MGSSPQLTVGSNLEECYLELRRQNLCSLLISLIADHQKWLAKDAEGLRLCTDIIDIKKRGLAPSTESTSDASMLYPEKLQRACAELVAIIRDFEQIVEALRRAILEVAQLVKSAKDAEYIVFRTWNIQRVLYFIDRVLPLFEQELKVKTKVKDEIGFCDAVDKLEQQLSFWQNKTHVEDYVESQYFLMAYEIS